MSQKNFYSLLDVNHTASTQEIKTAFHDLAKKYHPDKNIGDKGYEDYFKEIQNAYSVLSNNAKRKKYDSEFGHKNIPSSIKQKSPASEIKIDKKPDKSESYYFLICIAIASLLLYFIVNYSSK